MGVLIKKHTFYERGIKKHYLRPENQRSAQADSKQKANLLRWIIHRQETRSRYEM